jgi:glyoxylase-like metal-dependent hydrolase (beta-lactamase superfamily II)
MILHKFPSGPLDTNTLLIGCPVTKKAAVIDPAHESTREVLKAAQEANLTIEKILLTHSHWDHFADAALLKAKTKAKLFIHPLDVGNLETPGSDGIPTFITIEPVHYDYLLKEGDVIAIGNLSFVVIHTPGHSPGSVCFYAEKEKCLISGDTLFQGSIGNLHLATGSPDAMWKSLQKLSQLPKQTRVIPGHGNNTTIGDEPWLARAKEVFINA